MIVTQDRAIVGGALCILAAVAWLYTVRASTGMVYMGAQYTFGTWVAMMVAMMTPSAAPMVFAYSRVSRSRTGTDAVLGGVGIFLLGYLTLWTGFSLLAAGAETLLDRYRLLSPMRTSTSSLLSAAVLLAAGFYQFSPWKYTCLSKCRTPLGFLLTEWREGWNGAFIMGLRHGLFCAGCCWLIMAILFVAGLMSLAWIAVLTLIVLAEKVFPYGRWVSDLVGAAAVLGGGWYLIRG